MTSSEARRFDAAIVGGGHNGLVAATLLAQSGRRVVLVEASEALGGAGRTESFAPGYSVSTAHLLNRLHPEVIEALALDRHGLAVDARRIAPTVLLAQDRAPLVLRGDYGQRIEGDLAPGEARAFAALRAQLLRHVGVLTPFLARRPPDPASFDLRDGAGLALAGLALRRLGKEEMRDFLRMLLMNVSDVADEALADDRLKGLLAFDATLGSHLGPRSPTSLMGLYYRLAGELADTAGAQIVPVGGMGGVIAAMERAALAAGVTIRRGEPVAAIAVEDGQAAGVVLGSGERVAARTVLSAINPRTTMLDLVGARHLDTGLVRRLAHVRIEGNVAKLNLALAGLPHFTGVAPADLGGRILIAPSSDHVERAFNPAKYGEFSPEPVMELTIPSLADPSLAPEGGAVLSAIVQYAPYRLKGGWEAGRAPFLAAILAVLERQAPGLGDLVRHAELLTPVDIEARYGMPGGHWHHGELQVDQMLMARPAIGLAGYRTPIDGLFLCSAGSHPGGGISGLPGLNAARLVLAGSSHAGAGARHERRSRRPGR